MRSLSKVTVNSPQEKAWREISYPDLLREGANSETFRGTPGDTDASSYVLESERLRRESLAAQEESIRKSQELLARAREEAVKIRKDAYEAGYIKGMKDGCEEGRQKAYEEHKEELSSECRELEKKISSYVLEMEHAKERVMEEYLDDLKDIALAIGEKIIQASLKSSGAVVKNMILAAVEKLKKTAWAKIYIAEDPESGSAEIQGDAELLNELSKISDNVKIIVMDDASPGTCLIELPDEVMDISVGTQLENIQEILNNARV